MRTSRRQFLQSTGLAAGALLTSTRRGDTAEDRPVKKGPFKIVCTFDDDCITHFTVWAPMFAAAKAKATFYIITEKLGDGKRALSRDQVIELEKMGHEIASHSMTHPNLVRFLASDPKACEHEIRGSREALLSWGLKTTSFGYPHGPHNAAVEALVKEAGYTNARSSDGVRGPKDWMVPPENIFAWRIGGGFAPVDSFKKRILAARNGGGSFLAMLTHAAGNAKELKEAPGWFTSPEVVKECLEWATGEGCVFTTVREALGV